MIHLNKQGGSILPDSLTQLTKIAGLKLTKTSLTDSPRTSSAATNRS